MKLRHCVLLKEVLAKQIKLLADKSVTDWLSGMAQGVDLWCAQIVLDLRKENPALKLHCVLPCEEQESKWTASAQEHYRSILAQANEVIYVGQEYSQDCMLERNRYMVDRASILLAVYNGTYRSGTGMIVRYAQKLGKVAISVSERQTALRHLPNIIAKSDGYAYQMPGSVQQSVHDGLQLLCGVVNDRKGHSCGAGHHIQR